MKFNKPAKNKLCILAQLCKFIPEHSVAKLARELKIDSRGFSPWSHVVTLLYCQLVCSISLNDLCDSMRLNIGKLSLIRSASAPAKNTLSNANKQRDPELMKRLFWETFEHLMGINPFFGFQGRYKGLPRRFNKVIHAVDSSTIALVANCMDWAKHRRRKAAAKMHLRLNLNSFLPSFVLVEEASHNDAYRARELCAALGQGEIVLFDKAYVDYEHLRDLGLRGVSWVTRAKSNMSVVVVKRRLKKTHGNILRDDLVLLKDKKSRLKHPKRFRRVIAMVEVNGQLKEMTFITNNLEWAASSVCDLYQARWAIEVFFKQIKQTLKLGSFIGYSKRAIQWQIWAALLLYILVRFHSMQSNWPHSFTRILMLMRFSCWQRIDLFDMLRSYGTAAGVWRTQAKPDQSYLPGLGPDYSTTMGQHMANA
jgi:hypothetical protein